MTNYVNMRELALESMLELQKEGRQSHTVFRKVLEKYQYLPKQDRAFIPGSVKERWSTEFCWIM